MDYETPDLTASTSYGPIQASKITDPYHTELNLHIWNNIREAEQIIHSGDTKKLAQFLQKANSGNNIKNTLVSGDERRKGDNIFTNRLNNIQNSLEAGASHFPNTFRQSLLETWNAHKSSIQEKTEYLTQIHQNVVSALESKGDAGKERLEQAKARQQAFKESLASDLNQSWKHAASLKTRVRASQPAATQQSFQNNSIITLEGLENT